MTSESPLVFLPGWGFQANIGREFLLGQTLFIDLPLHTNTSCIKTVCDLIEKKRLPNHCVLIGWSLGGLLSLKLYERNPNTYKALILITSTPCFGTQKTWPGIPNEHQTIFKRMLATNYSVFFSYYLKVISNAPNALKDHIIPQELFNGYKPYQNILFQSDLRSSFSRIQVPTLMIQGTEDPIIPRNILSHLTALSPSLNYQAITGAGHIPFITHRIEIQKIISQFLTSTL
ncbi:MAG: alpha/beta fold hydrolase [Alphaproteobacteria bacterium]|nr:alpha/beta fold hydrolase [Alphaproteobacteria bacterium]